MAVREENVFKAGGHHMILLRTGVGIGSVLVLKGPK